ncbi:MAG: DUF2442 domain-containing protein [Saprospiraceae bacterium]|nr:DUF2442 domain-containing protein [Saprospiraceae bacterium]
MIPRVIKIIEIKGFDVTVLFNNGKILTIDFYSWIVPRAAGKNIYTQLLKENIFNTIGCNGITLYWPDLAEVTLLDGTIQPAEFDLDPLMLYEFASSKQQFVA